MTRAQLAAASRALDNPTFAGLPEGRRWEVVATCETCCRDAHEFGGPIDARGVAKTAQRELRRAGVPPIVAWLIWQAVYRLVLYILKRRYGIG